MAEEEDIRQRIQGIDKRSEKNKTDKAPKRKKFRKKNRRQEDDKTRVN